MDSLESYQDNPAYAPDLPRDERGWVILPSDKTWRDSLFFPPEVMSHPAKMNLHMEKSIIDWVSKPGDTVMDIFGGTGTLLIAALEDRKVILLELEDGYHALQHQARTELLKIKPDVNVILLQGDCQFIMPIPVNHIITSPPYASAMNISKIREGDEDDNFVKADKQMVEYSKSPRNLSKYNTFKYNQQMEKIYQRCYQSIIPGGTLTVNIKDRVEKGQRVWLSEWIKKVCVRFGFVLEDQFKWKVPGNQFTNIRRSKGEFVVDDEDVLVFRRPA